MEKNDFNLGHGGPDMEINRPAKPRKLWQRPDFNLILYLLFLLGSLYVWQGVQQTRQAEIPYREFLQKVDQGKVAEATITEDAVYGTLKAKDADGKPKPFLTIPLKDPARIQRLGGRMPKGLLLVGPPGTGKTLLARAVAGEAGAPFFNISGSEFIELFVGADLANIANEAAILAVCEERESIAMSDFEAAIDRVIAAPEKKHRVLDAEEKRRVAFHESGHAIVAMRVPTGEPVHKVSIIPRGVAALGYTLQLPVKEKVLSTEPQLKDQIAILEAEGREPRAC